MLIIQTTTFGAHGGIPAYNRLLCRAVNELPGTTPAGERRVLIATDQPGDVHEAQTEFGNLSIEAFGGNRLALTRRAIAISLKQRIDLVLIGHVNYAPLGLMLRRLRPKIRYGVILYGVEAWQEVRGLRRRALQSADFLISISEYTKQIAAKRNGLNKERIHLLPNALASNDIKPPTKTGRAAPPAARLLSVCRLLESERYKGVDKVIELMPDLLSKIPNLHYEIIGGGSDLARHQQLAQRLGVQDRVHFTGFLQPETLRDRYREADLFVMPSTGEGFGFVFLEAMQHRKPIVAANCTAVAEVIENGVCGLLVEPNNPAQLAEAIVRLCKNRELREKMGAAGFARVQQHFSFDLFKHRLSEILARASSGVTLTKCQDLIVDGLSAIETP